MSRIYEEIRVAEHDDPTNTSSIFIDPGWASANGIAEVFIALSELHRAKFGGNGLRFEPTGNLYTMKPHEVTP